MMTRKQKIKIVRSLSGQGYTIGVGQGINSLSVTGKTKGQAALRFIKALNKDADFGVYSKTDVS